MAINILVTEDESLIRKDIVMRLKKLGYNVVAEADTKEKAVAAALKFKPDLALMDIRLKADVLGGVEASREIKKQLDIPIIFLTANADKATVSEAKLVEPHGYIHKPFKDVDIQTAVEIAMHKHQSEKEMRVENELLKSLTEYKSEAEYLFIKEKGVFKKINPEDIYYVEALKDYVLLMMKDHKYTIHITMKELVKKLPKNMFQRIHRSYIVNMNKIELIHLSNLTVENYDVSLPIGGSYKKPLSARINVL